jgi:hypothetical protein
LTFGVSLAWPNGASVVTARGSVSIASKGF